MQKEWHMQRACDRKELHVFKELEKDQSRGRDGGVGIWQWCVWGRGRPEVGLWNSVGASDYYSK